MEGMGGKGRGGKESRNPSINSCTGAPTGTVSAQGGQTFLDKIRCKAPKIFLVCPAWFSVCLPWI